MTLRFGLIGFPVKHSVSPQMQMAGFKAMDIDASYELVEIDPANLKEGIQMLSDSFCGWNITVPHKLAMIDLVDEIDPAAEIAGSINTVLNENGRLRAWSTDGYGLEMAIFDSFKIAVKESRFTFWGTGGAARACGVYFASAGAKEINLVNRTVSKAEKLAEDILKANSSCTVNCLGLDEHSAIQSAFNASDVIIQSTSIGLHADDECSIPLGFMDKGMNIFEMIYRPTLLLSEAEKMGCNVIDGKGMLLYQGVKSFSIWNGIENSPVDAMREGLRQALL